MLIKYMYIDKITGKCSFVYLFIYLFIVTKMMYIYKRHEKEFIWQQKEKD